MAAAGEAFGGAAAGELHGRKWPPLAKPSEGRCRWVSWPQQKQLDSPPIQGA